MRDAASAILLLAAVMCSVAYCAKPQAADGYRFSAEACATLSEVVEQAADARDAGVPAKPYADYLRLRMARRGNEPVAVRAVLQEVRRVYAGTLAAGQLQLDAYTRCMTGMIGGTET